MWQPFGPLLHLTRQAAWLLVGCALVLALSACQSVSAAPTADHARQVAEQAPWGEQVAIRFEGEHLIVLADGIPSHEILPMYQAVSVIDFQTKYTVPPLPQPMRFVIPLQPKLAAQKTSTDIGVIGIMVSGALLYSPYEANRSTIALDDQFILNNIPFLDPCNGHPGPFGIQYHYHGVPQCLTMRLDKPGEHSRLLGYLFDGFAVYGPQDAGGDFIIPAALDECNGHIGPTPEFPDGVYHYHLTYERPYSIACYAGEVQLLPTYGYLRPLLQAVDFFPLDNGFFWAFVLAFLVAVGVGWRRYVQVERQAQPQTAFLKNRMHLATLLMGGVHVFTILMFTYAIPEHVVDPTWPDHAHHHAFQALLWNIGFNLLGLALLFSAFQRREKWAWGVLLGAILLMHGGYFLSDWVTGGGAPGTLDDWMFLGLIVVYGIGLALSWAEFKPQPAKA